MTIVIPGWAIVVGLFALLSDGTEVPKQPYPIPTEFWFLCFGIFVLVFLIAFLVEHLLKKKNT